MPGTDEQERLVHSLVVLLCLMLGVESLGAASFRLHIERLTEYLERASLSSLSPEQQSALRLVLDWVKQGRALSGPWNKFARKLSERGKVNGRRFWKELLRALKRGNVC